MWVFSARYPIVLYTDVLLAKVLAQWAQKYRASIKRKAAA